MITLIGGPDSFGPWSAADLAAFKALKLQRVRREKKQQIDLKVSFCFLAKGVESWAIAVATGATQLDLVNNIADRSPPAAYDHLQVRKICAFCFAF